MMMRQVLVVVLVILAATSASCRREGSSASKSSSPSQNAPPAVSIQELACGPMVEGDETGHGFFGRLAGKQANYEVWKWRQATRYTLEKDQTFALPSAMPSMMVQATVVANGRYLGHVYRQSYVSPNLLLASSQTGEAIREWTPPAGWQYGRDNRGMSSNGKFVAVIIEEDVGRRPPSDYNWQKPRYRIGRIDLSSLDLSWVGDLRGHGAATIRRIAVSDDGRYIAVGGWANGVALVDASVGNVLWTDRPPTEVSTGYVLFSADGLTLYTAGSEGCVYSMETRTGKILGRWWATETGQSIYGHRVSCLAMSPDGLWLAAGTGPQGHVYLWNTVSGDPRPRLLPHGERTVLVVTFSPDSQHLASVAGGKIKVWRVDP